MAFSQDPLSSPETFFYSITSRYVVDEEIDFLELDNLLAETAQNLDRSAVHVGAGRNFELTLDNFDENSEYKDAEILASFTVRLWEDDESEINLILKSISEELENIGIMVESINFLGVGRR
ncbi:MAG: hypothetical protein ACXAC7_02305 [Candidatus Hodarchaeales archaeon]|jgi:hypothetical protein